MTRSPVLVAGIQYMVIPAWKLKKLNDCFAAATVM